MCFFSSVRNVQNFLARVSYPIDIYHRIDPDSSKIETQKEGCMGFITSLPTMLPFMRRVLHFNLPMNKISVDVNGFWPLLVCS